LVKRLIFACVIKIKGKIVGQYDEIQKSIRNTELISKCGR